MSAVEAKTHFGKFLDNVQREPVIITKKNRPVGVMLSMQDIENTIWGDLAREADNEGYLTEDESDTILKKYLNDEA